VIVHIEISRNKILQVVFFKKKEVKDIARLRNILLKKKKKNGSTFFWGEVSLFTPNI